MTVPFFDLNLQYQTIRSEVLSAVDSVFQASAFSGGAFVESFEREFAAYCGSEFAVGVNSGTSALHLALRAIGIGPGDEVIVPAQTFIATAWAPTYLGARPVFVDSDPGTWTIARGAVEKALTTRTRAILGVHLYGQPFDVDALAEEIRGRGVALIEDAAQAHGASYRKRRVGQLGEMACFSFYPSKNLGAYGEGGAVVTRDAEQAAKIRGFRNHGSFVRYQHDEVGYNYRMDGVQAAILSVKLSRLESWNARRRAIAARYRAELQNPKIRLRVEPEWAASVHHLFVVLSEERDALRSHLSASGIETALHYPIPCHLQKAFSYLGHRRGDYPVAEMISAEAVSLPLYPEMSDAQVDEVIAAVNRY